MSTNTIHAGKDFRLGDGRMVFHGEILPSESFDPATTARMVACGWLIYGRPEEWLAKQAAERRARANAAKVAAASAPQTPPAKPAAAAEPYRARK